MKTKTYTVKKQKDGDYEVTLYNQTKVFSLKDVMMNFLEAQKQLKEVSAQVSLDKAVHKNIQDHHSDVVKMFEKLPKVKKTALTSYIEMFSLIQKSEARYKDVKKMHDKLKRDLADIHKVIPQPKSNSKNTKK